MSELTDALVKVLDDKSDKNYDPRMEELMRSDRLIDPSNEALSKLDEQENFHIAKIRGMQVGFQIPLWKVQKMYNLPHMKDYHTEYMDYIRNLNPKNARDLEELNSILGGMTMVNPMISELIKLRHAEDAWTAKLYADSIKPQVANAPSLPPADHEEQEGFFSKVIGFFFGKKQDNNSYRGR